MRIMTCRNEFIFVAAIGFGLMVTSARVGAGSLNAPAGPGSAASAMWTLKDIYDVLDTRTTNVTKRTSFKEPSAGPTVGTMHNLNDIMTLVTNRAPVPKTGQTPTVPIAAPVGFDGNLKIGVAWPNPRFTVVSASDTAETNQIRDNLTGLIWARNANLASNSFCSVNGTCTQANAVNVITNSDGPVNGANGGTGYGGTNDWRLPNVRELHSLIAWQYGNPSLSDGTGTNQWTEALGPFTGVMKSSSYWSSTTDAATTANAWLVYLGNGGTSTGNKTATGYVWPVRGGQ